MNEDKTNSSWPAYMIDLDLEIRKKRNGSLGVLSETGARAFMAIEALLDEKHSFMHDYESFFWVLLWICVHYNGMDADDKLSPIQVVRLLFSSRDNFPMPTLLDPTFLILAEGIHL